MGGPYFAPNPLASRREAILRNLAIMEREAREERELQAPQARQGQREQQELPEQRRWRVALFSWALVWVLAWAVARCTF